MGKYTSYIKNRRVEPNKIFLSFITNVYSNFFFFNILLSFVFLFKNFYFFNNSIFSYKEKILKEFFSLEKIEHNNKISCNLSIKNINFLSTNNFIVVFTNYFKFNEFLKEPYKPLNFKNIKKN